MENEIEKLLYIEFPNLIHEILIQSNYENKGIKGNPIIDMNVVTLKKVFNASIENTLNEIELLNDDSKEYEVYEKYIRGIEENK